MNAAAVDELSTRLLQAWDRASVTAPLSRDIEGFGLPAAWQVAQRLMQRRLARGEVIAGRKAGFTNRSI